MRRRRLTTVDQLGAPALVEECSRAERELVVRFVTVTGVARGTVWWPVHAGRAPAGGALAATS